MIPLLALLLLTAGVQAQKIGFTNVEALMSYMPETDAIGRQLETYSQALQKPLKVKQDYMDMKIQEYYEKMNGSTTGTFPEKERMEQEITALQQETQGATQAAEQKLMGRQMELMRPLMEKIQVAINEIAAEDGYLYILNQTSGTNILYGAENFNISEKLAGKLGIVLPKE